MVGELARVAAGLSGAMLYAVAVPSSQLFGPAVVWGMTGSGRVALTFDDGPSASTPAVWDALAHHRPPYGIRWIGRYPALRQHGLRAVLRSACVFDWLRPALRPGEAIEAGLRARATEAAILLLHDGDRTRPGDRRSAPARAVERVLPSQSRQGLRCVTLSELLS